MAASVYLAGVTAGPASYSLIEGSVTSEIAITLGFAKPYSNSVTKTRISIWSDAGNIRVAQTASGTLRARVAELPAVDQSLSTSNAPAIDALGRMVAEYNGQPSGNTHTILQQVVLDNAWSARFFLAGKPGAYGYDRARFSVEYLKSDGSVYASFTSSWQLSLVNAAGEGNPPSSPPSNIIATPISNTAISFTWTAPDISTASVIEFKLPTDSSWVVASTIQSSGDIEYVKTGLTALTTYQFRIIGTNSFGSGPYSGTITVKTLATPVVPSPPVIISATSTAFNTVAIQFTKSDEKPNGIGGSYPNTYRVYYRLTADPDVPGSYSVHEFDDSKTTVQIIDLAANTGYTFVMTAYNEAGESATFSNIVTATTSVDPNLPTAPTNFTVTTDDEAFISQDLAWTQTNLNNILGTFVYYCTDDVTFVPYQDAPLAPGITTFRADGLAENTTYYWAIFTYNNYQGTGHYSATATDSDTTGEVPDDADTPTLDSVVALDNSSIRITWSEGTNGEQVGFLLYRGVVSETYALIATLGAQTFNYSDTGLASNSRYYYAVKAKSWEGGTDSDYSNELSATTLINTGEVNYTSGFTLHEDSRNRIKEFGGRVIITSDRDRWLVRDALGDYFKAGLRPVRGTTSLAKASGGVLEDGTYRVYIVLCRGEKTRSVPSEASATVTISDASKKLVVTPPLNDDDTEIECRDTGYDVFGNTITGCDAWEIYVAEENQGEAYRVARLPVTVSSWEDSAGSKTYTIDDTLTLNDIFGGTRRPLELQGESSLPPSCWEAEVRDNRVYATGEVDLAPTATEIDDGATLVVSGGNKYFTLTDWDATDACIYHRLVINGIDTGWEIYDYDFDAVDTDAVTKCYIRHSDPAVNKAGFEGTGGSFTDFKLAGNPNRIYTSAYFSGEALSQVAFSPETFPPLTIFENEFFPDDNTSPNGIIASGGVLLVGKPERWVMASGGDEPDFPLLQTQSISRGSGLNAPFSMARDANDVVYYLGDTGPFRITPGGVEKVNIRFGNARLFTDVFSPSSVSTAIGSWFSREDWGVWCGLNRIGSTGNRDGFILDMRNGAIMPFTTPYEITHLKEYKSRTGEFQLLMGTTDGRIGYFLKRGMFIDGIDYTQPVPILDASSIQPYFTTGIVDTEHAVVPRECQPRIKTIPADAVFQFTIGIDAKRRTDNPFVFDREKTVNFNTSIVCDHVSLPSIRCNQIQFKVWGTTLPQYPNAYYKIRELPVSLVVKNAS